MSIRLILFLLALCLLGLPALDAEARLDPKEWRAVQAEAQRLFGKPGEAEAKAAVLERLVADGEKRAWKMVVDGLVREAEIWLKAAQAVRAKEDEMDEVRSLPMAKRTAEMMRHLKKWTADLEKLEATAREEHAILDAFTRTTADGPEALRKNLFQRAKGSPAWAVRAAAAGVAAVHPGEKLSFEFLTRALSNDSDPRVRMAGLEALRSFSVPADGEDDPGGPRPMPSADVLDTVDSLVLGRLADDDWGVQLLAVRIVETRRMLTAVPHLINALSFAPPRVVEAIGDLLREFTGENFDPYADVWAKWWGENKARFESDARVRGGKNDRPPSDAHFYGLPVKSDRILFIIDTSSSMKEVTKNENPAEKWKPQGPVTGNDGPPPPPPPEAILSGPKIKVAKHELKKAIEKLPASSMFNIIAFNTAVIGWRPGMQKASAKNKKEALAWVRALEPKGITFIDGALRTGFRMAGMGAADRAYYEVNIDTMVLLSDGAPTYDDVEEVKLMEPQLILDHVKEWNKHRRVVIHCIGVDMVEGIDFLKRLAAENGGEYVDR